MIARFSLYVLFCGLAVLLPVQAQSAPNKAGQWLYQQDANSYTLQVLKVLPAVDTLQPYRDFAALTEKLPQGRVLLYSRVSNKKRYYYLNLAVFGSAKAAQAAAQSLPASWPKSMLKIVPLKEVVNLSRGKIKAFKAADPRLKKLFSHRPPANKVMVQPRPAPVQQMPPKQPAPVKTQRSAESDSKMFIELGAGVAIIGDGDIEAQLQQQGHSVAAEIQSNPAVLQLALGYQFNPRWAAVLGFQQIKDVKTSVTVNGTVDTAKLATDIQKFAPYGFEGASLAARYRIPMGRWAVQTELGMLSWNAEKAAIQVQGGAELAAQQKLSGSDGFAGLGVEFSVAEDWAIAAKYQYFGVNDGASVVAATLQYAW